MVATLTASVPSTDAHRQQGNRSRVPHSPGHILRHQAPIKPAMIANNTTGLRSWPACRAKSSVATRQPKSPSPAPPMMIRNSSDGTRMWARTVNTAARSGTPYGNRRSSRHASATEPTAFATLTTAISGGSHDGCINLYGFDPRKPWMNTAETPADRKIATSINARLNGPLRAPEEYVDLPGIAPIITDH